MGDHQDTITEWAQSASTFRRLQAYAVKPDGSREPIDGATIVVEFDDERALIISLCERMEGEGLAICSLPQSAIKPAESDIGSDAESQASPTAASRHSLIVMRSGGANLLYLSPQLLGSLRE